MLFWSFVLAFVLSILYYLSPVHNVVQVEDKPLADTMVATFVNAHQAAKRLTYTDTAGKKTITKQCVDIDSDGKSFSVDCVDAEGNPIEIEVEDTSKRVITFTYKEDMQGLKTSATSGFLEKEETLSALDSSRKYSDGTLANISPDEIKKFLPAVSEETFDSYHIQSAFACITDAAEGDTTTTTTQYLTFDCQGGKGGGTGGKDESEADKKAGLGDYVITYMQAPTTDKATINRNELWRSGILRRTKGSHECGVLWKTNAGKITLTARKYNDDGDIEEVQRTINIEARKRYDEKSPYIMDNSRRFTVSVPTLIGEALAEDDALASDMTDGYLLFCITPMDDIKASFESKCDKGYGTYTIYYDTVSKDTNGNITLEQKTSREYSDCPKKSE